MIPSADADIDRLRSELEQAKTETEDAQAQIADLNAEVARLNGIMQRREIDRRASEKIVSVLRDRLRASSVSEAGLIKAQEAATSTEEELRVAMEELQVLTEEVEESNVALQKFSQELEQRVAQRTQELSDANSALRTSQERFQLAIQAAEAGSWNWNIKEDRLEWSPECSALHGIEVHTPVLSVQTWLSLVEPDDRKLLELCLWACTSQGEKDLRCEYRIRDGAGEIRWFLSRGTLLRDQNGHPSSIVGLTIDMTRRKASEVALAKLNLELNDRVEAEVAARQQAQTALFQNQKLEALGLLTGGFAHDFNNLLMVISGGLQLVAKSNTDERRKELVGRIQEATKRGVDITRRLLAFGRRELLKPERIELPQRLTEFSDLISHMLQPDIKLTLRCQDDVWPVLADQAGLEMALINLAMNARDAMSQGGIVEISCANRNFDSRQAALLGMQPGAYVEISVKDGGHGMAPDVLQRALEPFFSTKGPNHGTGLGLPQVYGFSQQSGGGIGIRSEAGAGSTISLFLPRSDGVRIESEPVSESYEMARLSILLVEDDPDVGVMVGDLLTDMGHNVCLATDALQAMDAIGSGEHFDLLFTDVILPGGWSGLDLAKRVSQGNPAMPIVLTTGYSDRIDQLGITPDFPLLRKPYTADRLSEIISRAVRQKAM